MIVNSNQDEENDVSSNNHKMMKPSVVSMIMNEIQKSDDDLSASFDPSRHSFYSFNLEKCKLKR